MTASRQVAFTASCSHLFTSCYDEFTCGNATVTATEAAGGELSTVTANYLKKSPISAEIDDLTSGFLSYPQGWSRYSRSRYNEAGARGRPGAIDPASPPAG